MGKKYLVMFFLVLLSLSVSANVSHQIDVREDSADINSSIKMDCTDCPVSDWQLTWRIPSGAEVLWVNGSEGEAEKVQVNGSSAVITTETEPKDSELIKIGMRVDSRAKRIAEGLHQREFSLAGFENRTTSVTVKNPELISGWASFGFETGYEKGEMRAVGEGPVNLRMKFGDGEKTKYYEFFEYEPTGKEDDTFRLSVGTLGILQNFKRFPVGVLSDADYNLSVNKWSSGEYVSGSIRLRRSLEEDFLPVLAHEVVHGLNDRYMRWDDTKSSYMDEGIAQYLEYIQRNKRYNSGEIDIGPAELFGEDKEYRIEEDGRTFVYTVKSRGNREKLWKYYQEDADYIKKWNPFDYPGERSFGYAYSELIIRNHVMKNGSVRDIYDKMEFSSKVKDPDRKWEFYGQHLDMTPCKYSSREKFDNCLDDINSYNYPVYMSSPDINGSEIVVEELELEEREQSNTGSMGDSSAAGFVDGLRQFLQELIGWLGVATGK